MFTTTTAGNSSVCDNAITLATTQACASDNIGHNRTKSLVVSNNSASSSSSTAHGFVSKHWTDAALLSLLRRVAEVREVGR